MKKNDGSFIALLVYVDDTLIGSTYTLAVNKVKEYLSSKCKLKDLGTVKYFLGLGVNQSLEGITICKRKYALDLLKKQTLHRYNTRARSKIMGDEHLERMDKIEKKQEEIMGQLSKILELMLTDKWKRVAGSSGTPKDVQ
ncbi:Reverse transcriptase [Theobroma cacao]|nr:Reverse transcriptase [Theobroma cacao]